MKDQFKKFTDLSSDLEAFAKRELSSALDGVDKTITAAVDIGNTSKNAIISAVDKSIDLIQSAADTEPAKYIIDTAQNLANNTAE